ncbi:hypothetical protein [Qiania dongpingensis]|uniref:Uncharacterized protein n=1 Tax=Qiania dongpingensis TaxID=2763669 RepID=A0A7G9G5J9_9FIRM|nr:hypothetical protein [Qiania dongpingensis]QNM06081.1 hypothetical protein H9Q78_02650 [Qiania dongpingensis]
MEGVDLNGNKTNKLSTKEYKEFLNLNNELADLYPDLSYHYDTAGNKILELGQNADLSKKKLSDFLEEERQATQLEIKENIPKVYDESQQVFNKSKDKLEQYKEANKIIQQIQKMGNQEFAFDEMGSANINMKSGKNSEHFRNIFEDAAMASGLQSDIEYSFFDDGNTATANLMNLTKEEQDNFIEEFKKQCVNFANEYALIYGDSIEDIQSKIQEEETKKEQLIAILPLLCYPISLKVMNIWILPLIPKTLLKRP